jgi:hypothetical protein
MSTPKTIELREPDGTPLVFTRKTEAPHDDGTRCEYATDDGKLACSVVLADDVDPTLAARALATALREDLAAKLDESAQPDPRP